MMRSPDASAALSVPETRAEMAAVLEAWFQRWDVRPHPQRMRVLLAAGLREADILAAGRRHGYPEPVMPLTRAELGRAMPFIGQIADQLAGLGPRWNVLFFGRDAESLFDAYAVRTGRGMLLPGSTALWERLRTGEQAGAGRFLEQFGLSAEALASGQPFLFVDTGFRGTIAFKVRHVLARLHGLDGERLKTRLPLAMAAKTPPGSHAQGVFALRYDDSPLCQDDPFPKASRIIGHPFRPLFDWERDLSYGDPLNERLAIALQLMPRFHAPYERLAERSGTLVAVPDRQELTADIDGLAADDDACLTVRNPSLVHPAAALIAQAQVVRAFSPQDG